MIALIADLHLPEFQSRFKLASRQPGLPDDGLNRPKAKLRVQRNRDRDRGIGKFLLHHDVTAALPHLRKTIAGQNRANFLS